MRNCTMEPGSVRATRVEEAIISALQAARSDLSLFETVERLIQLGVANEELAKTEINRLLAEGKLEITPHRLLHLRSNGRRR